MTNALRIKVVLSTIVVLGTLMLCLAQAGFKTAAAQEVPNFFSTKINVGNLEKSVDFYTRIMGLQLTGKVDNAKISEVVLTRSGGNEVGASEQALILYYAKERKEPIKLGTDFNNLLFVFPDLKELLRKLDAEGYQITGSREMRPLTSVPFAKSVMILFTKDPDGRAVELVQYGN